MRPEASQEKAVDHLVQQRHIVGIKPEAANLRHKNGGDEGDKPLGDSGGDGVLCGLSHAAIVADATRWDNPGLRDERHGIRHVDGFGGLKARNPNALAAEDRAGAAERDAATLDGHAFGTDHGVIKVAAPARRSART